MAKPQKKPDPRKDADKSFLRNRVGQSFDMDDDTPSTPPAPETKKPANIDFKPYRPNSNQPKRPIEYDEFGVYDDDDEDDNAFWGEDDDMEDDPLYNVANRILPDRPEINVTINSIANFDMTCLVAAGLIEEEMRGRTKDALVDSLTSAALLVGAENFDDVAANLSAETVSLVDSFMAAVENGTPSTPSFQSLDMQTQRLMVAMMTADLEMLHKGMNDGYIIPPSDFELETVGRFLADASRQAAEKATSGDVRLMKRAAKAFNEVSHALPLDVKMRQAEDLGFDLVDKSTPEPPKAAKQQPPKPKGKPQPPRH